MQFGKGATKAAAAVKKARQEVLAIIFATCASAIAPPVSEAIVKLASVKHPGKFVLFKSGVNEVAHSWLSVVLQSAAKIVEVVKSKAIDVKRTTKDRILAKYLVGSSGVKL